MNKITLLRGLQPFPTVDEVRPVSIWMLPYELMNHSLEDARAFGIVKTVEDIKPINESGKKFEDGISNDTFKDGISNDTFKDGISHGTFKDGTSYGTFKDGISYDTFSQDQDAFTIVQPNVKDGKNMFRRQESSNYLHPPLKRSFRSTFRIKAFVSLAVTKFKRKLFLKKIERGEVKKDAIDSINFPQPKFKVFKSSAFDNQNTVQMKNYFSIEKADDVPRKIPTLTDEMLSASLEYLFRKTSEELIEFNSAKDIFKFEDFGGSRTQSSWTS